MKPKRRNFGGARSIPGHPVHVIKSGRQVHAAPTLKDGQARCPVCRQAVTLTSTGRLRQHRDLTGYPCTNRAANLEPVHLDELPPVIIPGLPDWRPDQPPPEPKPPKPPGPRTRGSCQTCGALVSGERRFCGICLARRMQKR